MELSNSTRDIDKWNQRYAQKDAVWSLEPNRFLVEELQDLPPGRAVDLGAGEGRNALWLAEQNWQVTAIDFADRGLARGREIARRRHLRVEWICADVTRYPLEPASYDLAIMLYLHIPEAGRKVAIKKAIDCLSPRGHFIYIGHDARNIAEGLGGPQDPAVLCSALDIVADLPGFDILAAQTRQREVKEETGHGETGNDNTKRHFALDTLVHGIKQSSQL